MESGPHHPCLAHLENAIVIVIAIVINHFRHYHRIRNFIRTVANDECVDSFLSITSEAVGRSIGGFLTWGMRRILLNGCGRWRRNMWLLLLPLT